MEKYFFLSDFGYGKIFHIVFYILEKYFFITILV